LSQDASQAAYQSKSVPVAKKTQPSTIIAEFVAKMTQPSTIIAEFVAKMTHKDARKGLN
jgi:hypothetical protein